MGGAAAFADQVVHLAGRSVVRTVTPAGAVISPLVFPLMLLAVNSGGLKAETRLPGFPTHSFVAFALAVPFIQGALFATMNAGTDLARDIQTGFLNRLSLTPMRGIAVLAGQLGGVVALSVIQAAVYIAVGLIVGVHIASGAARRARAARASRCSSRSASASLGRARGAAHRARARPCRACSRPSSSSCSSRR